LSNFYLNMILLYMIGYARSAAFIILEDVGSFLFV